MRRGENDFSSEILHATHYKQLYWHFAYLRKIWEKMYFYQALDSQLISYRTTAHRLNRVAKMAKIYLSMIFYVLSLDFIVANLYCCSPTC